MTVSYSLPKKHDLQVSARLGIWDTLYILLPDWASGELQEAGRLVLHVAYEPHHQWIFPVKQGFLSITNIGYWNLMDSIVIFFDIEIGWVRFSITACIIKDLFDPSILYRIKHFFDIVKPIITL